MARTHSSWSPARGGVQGSSQPTQHGRLVGAGQGGLVPGLARVGADLDRARSWPRPTTPGPRSTVVRPSTGSGGRVETALDRHPVELGVLARPARGRACGTTGCSTASPRRVVVDPQLAEPLDARDADPARARPGGPGSRGRGGAARRSSPRRPARRRGPSRSAADGVRAPSRRRRTTYGSSSPTAITCTASSRSPACRSSGREGYAGPAGDADRAEAPLGARARECPAARRTAGGRCRCTPRRGRRCGW